MSVTIYNTIRKAAGGTAQDDFNVRVDLSWDTTLSPVAINEDDGVMFKGVYQTDADGRWEVAVVENDVITPAGSVYKITETERSTAALVNEYYVSAYVILTPVDMWVGELLVDKPSWEE
jgi:hypothetical protein